MFAVSVCLPEEVIMMFSSIIKRREFISVVVFVQLALCILSTPSSGIFIAGGWSPISVSDVSNYKQIS